MGKQPLIGVTLDFELGGEAGHWSKAPYYAIRDNYSAVVEKAGGLPVLLPHNPELALDYALRLDALLVSGGGFDIDPKFYGAAERHPSVRLKERRTAFEWRAMEGMIAAGKPVLGICGGEQLLAVLTGGTLIQHLPDEVGESVKHKPGGDASRPMHCVTLTGPSRLADLAKGAEELGVNSSHHQAVKSVGKSVRITAKAPDGVIEAIELDGHPFAIGVQWHPEYHVSAIDGPLLAAFVAAAQR